MNVTIINIGRLPNNKNGIQSFTKQDTGTPETLDAVNRFVATGGVI